MQHKTRRTETDAENTYRSNSVEILHVPFCVVVHSDPEMETAGQDKGDPSSAVGIPNTELSSSLLLS